MTSRTCWSSTLSDTAAARLAEVATVHDGSTAAARERSVKEKGAQIRAVLTIGSIGLAADLIEALPQLGMASCMGVGYEHVDLEAAKARGLVITNGHGTNASSVADHALALMLATVRGVVAGDAAIRRGEWRGASSARPELTGMRLGIYGLGMIGDEIARRCAGGFAMSVGYHNRRPRPDVTHRYHASVVELAGHSDVLVLAAPGGVETKHAVSRAALAALGPDGFLINIARGTLVDTAALIEALREGGIAGAGLDVVEGEPDVPAELLAQPNLVMTPHIAGRSPQSQRAMIDHATANFRAFFAGEPVRNRIL